LNRDGLGIGKPLRIAGELHIGPRAVNEPRTDVQNYGSKRPKMNKPRQTQEIMEGDAATVFRRCSSECEYRRPMSDAKRNLIPMKKALEKLGCGRTRAYELINGGKIIAYKDGHSTLVDLDSIEAYHASLKRIQPRVS